MASLKRTLKFNCQIIKGIGRYSELEFPDNSKISEAPSDWPSDLYRGSLNALINEKGYPEEIDSFLGPGVGIKKLDNGKFLPEFTIPHDAIGNNKLGPTTEYINGGMAQIWRATLKVTESDQEKECWVVRRIGSGLKGVLEIVSDKYLREEMNLVDEDCVTVTIYEGPDSES